ncbi:MAG: alpha/beta fold hydrolase, partial [Pseudomonadota bacterium]
LCMAGQYGFAPQRIFSFNGALEPIHGNAIFAPLARLLFVNPFVPRLFALRARFGDIAEFVLSKTGSDIDATGKQCYRTLLQSSEHVEGALGMMANWDLDQLKRLYPDLQVPVILVAAENDLTVPASVSRRAAALLPNSQFILLPQGGHLLHEVEWREMAKLISDADKK